MPMLALVPWNVATSAPGFPPGTLHISSPGFAFPVSAALPAESHPPTSTFAAGRRKFATGRKVFTSSPKVIVRSSLDESLGRSKWRSEPST